eukprot:CAMPEP_0170093358 /NCGR_PEP_ID=MMETSP0019_2-20121128/26461_1 /TAXON_ID=98059 /ORGANISM="Dinobryon sp., Strain UTEXLB2267" /LENGTH=657 /DNA_ID=CAMNT_0010314179 /DNA_START=131 /DNA_END=2104 /DNA_ORIENTATION=+
MEFDTFVEVASSFEAKCNPVAPVPIDSVNEMGEPLSLSDYMRLPVDQYVCIKMPLDAVLERDSSLIGNSDSSNRFILTVPPVRFFNLDVSPQLVCYVTQSNDTVTICSKECVLRGSPFVVSLNGCYKIDIKTTFRWTDTPSKKSILSTSKIFVEVNPPSPFKFFGKPILESTGNLAMSIALRQIENAFVQSLARDYERWVTDQEYRESRAASAPKPTHLPEVVPLPVPPPDPGMLYQSSLPAETILQLLDEAEAADMDETVTPVPSAVGESDRNGRPWVRCEAPPAVSIEEAPLNGRRIFSAVDVSASSDTVWATLTRYESLQTVVPSLVSNQVLARTDQGARLLQVGGAKVLPGVTFTAKTVLDVATHTTDSPLDPSMLADSPPQHASEAERGHFFRHLPLQRGRFPQPEAVPGLPFSDITMQNVEGEGDFEHYQGVWRVQALAGPPASSSSQHCRLSYAVEIRPRGFLPVGLIQGRIASDLQTNLLAIRDHCEALQLLQPPQDVEELFGSGGVETDRAVELVTANASAVEMALAAEEAESIPATAATTEEAAEGERSLRDVVKALGSGLSRLLGRRSSEDINAENNASEVREHTISKTDSDSVILTPQSNTDSVAVNHHSKEELLVENQDLKRKLAVLEEELAGYRQEARLKSNA